ncbi:MAG: outer membrane protein transport protein, partial [Deltaproteobacteria bacterium]|nr:outer membrane protein transport protein [Deltaproteobacteria bacterium]MBW2530539.1 outer membrane protein transport protein [Deltaproteobacteria bacterium]
MSSGRRCRSTGRAGLACFALASAPAVTLAGGYEVAQQSAVAAGTGSASTARDDDAGGAWYNPAALADGGGLRTALGVTFALSSIYAEAQPQSPDAPWSVGTDREVSTPAYLYASAAYADWVAGVSVNTPFGSSIAWPEGWPARFDILMSKFQLLRLAPFFGYRLGPVRLAAGPQFDFARFNAKRATQHVIYEGSSALVASGVGFGGQAAAFFDLGEYAQAGVSYKSRAHLPLDGDADFSVPEVFARRFPDQRVSLDWTVPDRIAAGLAVDAGDFRVLLDFTATLWSVNDSLEFDFSEEVTDDREQINEWRDSFALRTGLEWTTPFEPLLVRAGFYADGLPSPPPPDETLSPSSPDATRLALTMGGTGHITDYLAFDAFYEHLRLLERSSTSPDAPLATYRGHAHVFGIAVRGHTPFAAAEPAPEPKPAPAPP